ncbi:MAG: CRISPR system precrRNA processing endoribonuclease RAMP protein Cas6 [Desulfuromonadaceae bacterium]|nr:CRISPR system precrRNA processing endoribonuclease RAMP protein Cas6 [Desulfuromonadaceae bacterium]
MMKCLHQAEFACLRFELVLQEGIEIDLATLLRLRRRLRSAGQYALTGRLAQERLAALFEPPLPADPVAVKRYQKAGPAFVLQPTPDLCRFYSAGDVLCLPLVLWGQVHDRLVDLLAVFQALGVAGLRHDRGRFVLGRVQAQNSAGEWLTQSEELTRAGVGQGCSEVPIRDLHWWLNSTERLCDGAELVFQTPARLLSQGRPLFRPRFSTLFPFVLRRVSSLLYAHCRLELPVEAAELCRLAQGVEERENRLSWCDWRELDANDRSVPVGGVVGSVTLAGFADGELEALLKIGTLCNLGKNAAYGAGSYAFASPDNVDIPTG